MDYENLLKIIVKQNQLIIRQNLFIADHLGTLRIERGTGERRWQKRDATDINSSLKDFYKETAEITSMVADELDMQSDNTKIYKNEKSRN